MTSEPDRAFIERKNPGKLVVSSAEAVLGLLRAVDRSKAIAFCR
jgi:hypothetical protein